MIKSSRQLKDLIRNLSKEKSADAQILMRNYMMERFLERISRSAYKDKFILKGGMLVAAMVGLDARSTMDIDATVKGATIGVDKVTEIITEIISVQIDDGVEFHIKRVSEIMDEAEYAGIRFSMETRFDGAVILFFLLLHQLFVLILRFAKFLSQLQDLLFLPFKSDLYIQRFSCHGHPLPSIRYRTQLFSEFSRFFTHTSGRQIKRLQDILLCRRNRMIQPVYSVSLPGQFNLVQFLKCRRHCHVILLFMRLLHPVF